MRVIDGADFGTRECPSCGCDVAANHNHCPMCGYLFPIASPRQRRIRLWGALIMLGLFVCVYLLGFI